MSPPVGLYDACAREATQMVATPTTEGQASVESDTLIFVDIDGVLNIGIGDPDGAPLQFSEDNSERALARWDQRHGLPSSQRIAVERIVETYSHEVGPCENAPYAKFLSAPDTALNDLLVGRLARIIEAAGPRCQVVLSSTWRMPRHMRRARQVEAALSRHLGRYFAFDARTAIRDDSTPELRLQCIADFAAEHCRKAPWVKQLRMLVLEDFHTTPFGTWRCGWQKMCSADAVEQYLRSRVPASVDASARLVHTYDEWTTDGGLFVQLGCGLTKIHFDRALDFLGALSDSGNVGVPKVPVTAQKDGGEVANADEHPATRKGPDWVKMSDALAQAFLRTGIACVG
jgi:hypothetical protein